MANDFSRVRLNPLLDYAGVELKQGGVLLDADANELVAILDRRLRALASDTLGRATVSSTTPGAFKITVVGGRLRIGRGRLYVDGLLAENHGAGSSDPAKRTFDPLLAEPTGTGDVDYTEQPYPPAVPEIPIPPPLPAGGRHLVYLDVWEREVTHLERPDLVESAVGVETSSRLQTVWQVRVLADEAGAGATCGSPDADLPGWADLIAPSTGLLSTGTFDVPPGDDPCELPPTGGYRGRENQLYRVEIHDPGQPGGAATFKWSRENASVGSRVKSVDSATRLELETLGRDDVLRLSTGDWVEIVDDARELSQAGGELRRVTVDEAARKITFIPALPATMLPGAFPDTTFPKERNLRVRRWDQRGQVFRTDPGGGAPVPVQDVDAPGSTGAIRVPAAGTVLLLENGITVSFASTGAKGFKAGDYWVFAARTSDASVELLDRAPPRGIHHHYARLAIWDVGAGPPSDCRNPWPPSGGDEGCGCGQCVTPESHASGRLTIQGAVDRVRDTGGTVCLRPGHYALREPVRIAGARSLRIAGQGPATMITCPGTAFVIQRSVAIAIEGLTVLSLGDAAISVRTAIGLALRNLVVAAFARTERPGAAVALSGVVAGATIEDNLLLAPEGIRALEAAEGAPRALLTAGLLVDDNAFLCRDAGVRLAGSVLHLAETRLSGNQVLGTHVVGFAAEGLTAPGASVRVCGNDLAVHGPGVRCAVDGAWIGENKLRATRDGERVLRGSGIELSTGLDKNGSDQAQVLANQIDGFAEAGIAIHAPLRVLLVKQNVIERCGNGILMDDSAGAGLLSIEGNHLGDIGATAAGDRPFRTLGIGIARVEAATVAGNMLRRIGVNAALAGPLIAGIHAFAVERVRILGNDVAEVGPAEDVGGLVAGILVQAPFEQAEVMHNHVERDARLVDARSATSWHALLIKGSRSAAEDFLRLANYTALRLDERRALVMVGNRAYVSTVPPPLGVDPAAAATRGCASVIGNVLIARGREVGVGVVTGGDLLFGDNRCELRASPGATAVLLDAPVAVVNANRVRGGEVSIRIPRPGAIVTVIGNITTSPIQAPIPPEMLPLNRIG